MKRRRIPHAWRLFQPGVDWKSQLVRPADPKDRAGVSCI